MSGLLPGLKMALIETLPDDELVDEKYTRLSMPFSCASIGAATVLATTSAVAPEYAALIATCGGASSGYCSIGETVIATAPASTIRSEMTDERIGRSMKKCVNTARY